MATNSKRQGLAITSLVLGVLGVSCFQLFAGIPAIILGHIAYSRSRKRPDEFSGAGLGVAGFVLGYASIFTTLIVAGMLLPALAKFKSRAQSIKCINNMKNIGLAFRIYATDHNDLFPMNASTNDTETVEAGQAPKAAVALNDVQIFQALEKELVSPSLLVCPGDRSRHPAVNFSSLQPDNISYEVEIGPDVTETNPGQVLARCPVHGHELYCDGSVHQGRWR